MLLGKNNSNIALLICDIQSKTIKNLTNSDNIIKNINKLLMMKRYIPSIVFSAISEFIPEKLGKTHTSIDINNIDMIYRKDTYSMVNDKLYYSLKNKNIEDIILTGMETQWCINRTTQDLSELNYRIHIPIDCIGNSKNNYLNKYNLEHLKNNGALLTTSDAFICSNLIRNTDIPSKIYLDYLKNNK
tara:strand:- start:1010 stop:1570 length:561 start_codon:yes stop_codon:yes gene_type:complete